MPEANNDLPEGFKMTELGPLPEGWGSVRLGKILTPNRVKIKREDYDGNIPIVEKIPFNNGQIIFRYKKQTRTDLYMANGGNLITSKINFHQGAVAITVEPTTATTHYEFYKVLSEANINYLWRYFRSEEFKRLFAREIKFRGFKKEANYKFIKDFSIPLPPLPEQQKIATVLSAVQEAREKTEDVIKATRELKKSLMKHLFTYGPVPLNEAENVPLKETEIGMITEHWKVVTVGDAIRVTQYGISLRGNNKGQYPILRMNNLNDGRMDTSDLQYVDLDEDGFQKFRVNRGDILFNRTNSYELVGKTALFDLEGEFVFASYLVKVVTDTSILAPQYLNYYLNCEATQSRLKMLATRGVSQSNINATKLRRFHITLPTLSEQHQIAQILSAMDEKIEAEGNKRKALEGLFKSLLSNLMTGRIKVKDLNF